MAAGQVPQRRRFTRRQFLRRALQVSVGLAGSAGIPAAYGFWEASQIRVQCANVALPHLPRAFAGKTIAILADLHHGPFVGLGFIREAVRLANSLAPDLFALVGDYAHKSTHTVEQLGPCLEVLSELRAPLGVFAVPGNHDMQHGGAVYREAITATPLTDLTNRSLRLTVAGEHLWLAGGDDLWWGKPDQTTALKDVPERAGRAALS